MNFLRPPRNDGIATKSEAKATLNIITYLAEGLPAVIAGMVSAGLPKRRGGTSGAITNATPPIYLNVTVSSVKIV